MWKKIKMREKRGENSLFHRISEIYIFIELVNF